jgi:HAAS domain-containing protein
VSRVSSDLIARYLEELYAGLRVPAAEAELIAAEAEDHLRETTAAGLAVGMTEREAQEAAISSFGPVPAVVRAHRRRAVTVAAAAMAAWKLAALLATTVGVGGLAGMGIFTYLLRSAPPGGPGPDRSVLVVYAALTAGGLLLLAGRWLTGRGTRGRDLLPPGVTASCFLLASVLLGILGFLLPSAPAAPSGPTGSCSFVCSFSEPAPGPTSDPVLTVLVVYAAVAAVGLVLLAARELTGRGTPGWDLLPPGATAVRFLLGSALLVALIVRLIVSGRVVLIAPAMTVSWTTPLSVGSISAAPLVSGAVVAVCLAVAAGYGLQAALRRTRRRPRSSALGRVLDQADRGGAGRAYV